MAKWHWLNNLTVYAGNPIIAKDAGTDWKSTDVGAPNVFYDTPNNRWVMNFGAWGSVGKTGLAYNSDISNLGGWTEEATNPIWEPSGAAGESGMASNGSMCVKGSTYYFAYNTIVATKTRLLLASGNSVLTLTRVNPGVPFLELGGAGEWDESAQFAPYLRVAADGETLEVYYVGRNADGQDGIGWATSANNGADWTKQGRLLAPVGSVVIDCPGAYFGGQCVYASTYNAVVARKNTAQFLTNDGGASWHGPVQILSHGAPGAWDSLQRWDPCIVEHNQIAYVFFSGADTAGLATAINMQIGVATMPYPYHLAVS